MTDYDLNEMEKEFADTDYWSELNDKAVENFEAKMEYHQ